MERVRVFETDYLAHQLEILLLLKVHWLLLLFGTTKNNKINIRIRLPQLPKIDFSSMPVYAHHPLHPIIFKLR